jgi:hypothetical protein
LIKKHIGLSGLIQEIKESDGNKLELIHDKVENIIEVNFKMNELNHASEVNGFTSYQILERLR